MVVKGKILSESEHNKRIDKIASLIVLDNISLDERDPQKLKKYYDFVKSNFNLEGEPASQLVNEAFLYLKLKSAKDVDPLQEGDKFGVGFS